MAYYPIVREVECDEDGITVGNAVFQAVDREDLGSTHNIRNGDTKTTDVVYPGHHFEFNVHSGNFGPIKRTYFIKIVKMKDGFDVSFSWKPMPEKKKKTKKVKP
jgi:hypothetical protein